MKKTPRAILIDLDGTLADTKPLLFQAYETLLSYYGRKGTQEEFDALDGLPLSKGMEKLRELHEIDDNLTSMLALHANLFASNHKHAAPMPGAEALLKAAQSAMIPCCVVTSASTDIATSWLNQNKLNKYVAFVISSDNVTHGKPAPEPYLIAASKVGHHPELCLALEDSESGLNSAVAAGCCTYLVSRDTRRDDVNNVPSLVEALELLT